MLSVRRSMLFIPGNNPGMLQNGGVFGADSVILDLEDAVAPKEKDAARLLVANALKSLDFGESEKVVRLNPLESYAQEDIQAIVPYCPDILLVPKVQSALDIQEVVSQISKVETKGQKPVNIIALIETPKGLLEAYNIATADKRVVALAFGAEDYTAVMGSLRTKEGAEIHTARSLLVNAAAAANIDAIDTPFTDINDNEGLARDTILAKHMGYKGKFAINPRQIEIIHNAFNPAAYEIDWAERVIQAFRRGKEQGTGVVAVDGKMVDAPIVNRAERIIRLASMLGLRKEVLE